MIIHDYYFGHLFRHLPHGGADVAKVDEPLHTGHDVCAPFYYS